MAKPKTTYTNQAKNATTFAKVTKNTTSYTLNSSPTSAWFLNSTFLTLNSTVYFLNGYLTAIAPNQLNSKNATTFAEI